GRCRAHLFCGHLFPGAFSLPGAERSAPERSEFFRTRRLFLFPRYRVDDERHRVAPVVLRRRRRPQESPTVWLLFPLLPPAFATKRSRSDWRPIEFADRPFLSALGRVPLEPLPLCFPLPQPCLVLLLQSFSSFSDLVAQLRFASPPDRPAEPLGVRPICAERFFFVAVESPKNRSQHQKQH